MSRRKCRRHGRDYPCTCAMGNLSRFIEPVVLLLLKKKGNSYGYDLLTALEGHGLTDAEIEGAALYRTLRQLERNGNVRSGWAVDHGGPVRHMYRLTANGERHLQEWATVLDHVSKSMGRFVKEVKALENGERRRVPGQLKRTSKV
jgi:PadR family transcriptional regulator